MIMYLKQIKAGYIEIKKINKPYLNLVLKN